MPNGCLPNGHLIDYAKWLYIQGSLNPKYHHDHI